MCTSLKSETTVLLLLQGKIASWMPELGVYEIDKNDSDELSCKYIDKLNDYAPLSFYHRGARLLLPLKHMALWSL